MQFSAAIATHPVMVSPCDFEMRIEGKNLQNCISIPLLEIKAVTMYRDLEGTRKSCHSNFCLIVTHRMITSEGNFCDRKWDSVLHKRVVCMQWRS